jgi:uncharacterized membrane protein YdjX (TVP38/TMEM64 family)
VLAAALVVIFAALAAMLAFVSSWAIVPFAVFTWGTTETLFLLWSGWLLGGAAAYTVGRFLGRPGVRWLTSSDVLSRYEQRITPRSAFGLVLLLQLGLPSEIPGYLLGLVRYPFRWYLLSLALAEMLHGIATVYIGAGLVQRRPLPVVLTVVALALLMGSAAWGLRRRLTSAPHDPPVTSPIPDAHVPA